MFPLQVGCLYRYRECSRTSELSSQPPWIQPSAVIKARTIPGAHNPWRAQSLARTIPNDQQSWHTISGQRRERVFVGDPSHGSATSGMSGQGTHYAIARRRTSSLYSLDGGEPVLVVAHSLMLQSMPVLMSEISRKQAAVPLP